MGFEGVATAEKVVEEMQSILQQLLGNESDANVLTTIGSTKYGVIEVPSVQSKVKFWKKVQGALTLNEEAFGKVFFKNNKGIMR